MVSPSSLLSGRTRSFEILTLPCSLLICVIRQNCFASRHNQIWKDEMPSIEENRSWGTYSWPKQGDEWSQDWGDALTHWHATILPRIRNFLPAKRILEIAPGHGRWSGFLMDNAEYYIGVDLNPECITACKQRFAKASHATFIANDGKSLDAVADDSVDFAFSFDSLVHCEIDVIGTYLHELSRKLTPDGVAFIHHSNLGEYSTMAINLSRLLWVQPDSWPLANVLRRLQLTFWDNWRAPSVTSRKVFEIGKGSGLDCIGQEIINWGRHNRRMVDCISILTRSGSRWERPNVVVRNPYFMAEARSAHAISEVCTSLRLRDK
jgi:SAM-dependent methyltransferase